MNIHATNPLRRICMPVWSHLRQRKEHPRLPSVRSIVRRFLPRIDASPQLALTTARERAYCRWAAEEYYSGQGQLIEMGCWLGSLTRALAGGLVANQAIDAASRRVHVFDRFTWISEWESLVKDTKLAGRFQPGEDCQEAFLERISDYRELVSVTKADLGTYRYTGPPIEILVLDVMKTAALTKNIAQQFFPHLIPGKALVINQDYCHYGHPWIHIAAYHLRDSLHPVGVVPRGSMAVFRSVKDVVVPEHLADEPTDYTMEEIDEAYAWNRAVLPEKVHDSLAAAEVQLLLRKGAAAEAEKRYRDYVLGPYRDSFFLNEMYWYNKKWGYILFDDPRVGR